MNADGLLSFLSTTMKKNSAESQMSRLRRIEQHYGNLDEIYHADLIGSIQSELDYSKANREERAPNPSKIAFGADADLYEGLASIRNALRAYMRFQKHIRSHA